MASRKTVGRGPLLATMLTILLSAWSDCGYAQTPDAAEQEALRRRPGRDVPTAAPVLEPLRPATPTQFVAMPDRWRIVENIGVHERWLS